MASHTHWPPDLIERLYLPPYPVAPVCRFKTKRECDEFYTTYLHGHTGTPCVKAIQESKTKRGRMNKIATCTLIGQELGGSDASD